jgi:hypothetical protein
MTRDGKCSRHGVELSDAQPVAGVACSPRISETPCCTAPYFCIKSGAAAAGVSDLSLASVKGKSGRAMTRGYKWRAARELRSCSCSTRLLLQVRVVLCKAPRKRATSGASIQSRDKFIKRGVTWIHHQSWASSARSHSTVLEFSFPPGMSRALRCGRATAAAQCAIARSTQARHRFAETAATTTRRTGRSRRGRHRIARVRSPWVAAGARKGAGIRNPERGICVDTSQPESGQPLRDSFDRVGIFLPARDESHTPVTAGGNRCNVNGCLCLYFEGGKDDRLCANCGHSYAMHW